MSNLPLHELDEKILATDRELRALRKEGEQRLITYREGLAVRNSKIEDIKKALSPLRLQEFGITVDFDALGNTEYKERLHREVSEKLLALQQDEQEQHFRARRSYNENSGESKKV
jgi:hypothetical protein